MVLTLKEYEKTAPGGKSLEQIVYEAGELAALPQVILKLIDLTADPKVSAADVEKVIQTDQGTTARVLTLANSSYYGLPRRISSIREAVVFLGFKSIRTLAMQVTAFNMFVGKSDHLSIARRNLWKHSLQTALCTRVIYKWLAPADAAVIEPEDAYTAALLHDMGKMALEKALPDNYSAALSITDRTGLRFHEVETDYLPYSHSLVGSAMAEHWVLPDTLCDTILNHHTPLDAQKSLPLTALVALADEIASGAHERLMLVERDPDATDAYEEATTILGLTPDVLSGMTTACKLELDKGLTLSPL